MERPIRLTRPHSKMKLRVDSLRSPARIFDNRTLTRRLATFNTGYSSASVSRRRPLHGRRAGAERDQGVARRRGVGPTKTMGPQPKTNTIERLVQARSTCADEGVGPHRGQPRGFYDCSWTLAHSGRPGGLFHRGLKIFAAVEDWDRLKSGREQDLTTQVPIRRPRGKRSPSSPRSHTARN
jgi:hypothetical protein